MRGLFLLSVQFLFLTVANAQLEDGSLTEEFSNLTAKQRARIAKKEAKEAPNDFVFQAFMSSADSLFQINEYNAAMVVYKNARKQRPYNVHPKVKIQDLQDLIDQEEQMNGELANVDKGAPIVISDLNIAPKVVVVKEDVEQETVPDLRGLQTEMLESNEQEVKAMPDPKLVPVNLSDKKPLEKEVVQKESTRVSRVVSEPSVFNIPVAEDGVNKEVYREGNAVITQLTVVRDGRTDIYKKVYHQWGYVFYFKNGSAITERMWADETLTFY